MTHKQKKYRVTVSRDLLNDELGNDASFDARDKYVEKHFDKIQRAAVAKIDGGFAPEPFASGIGVELV
jgi:hypothetical protein